MGVTDQIPRKGHDIRDILGLVSLETVVHLNMGGKPREKRRIQVVHKDVRIREEGQTAMLHDH